MKATEIAESVELFEVASNSFVTIKQLKDWLPTIESALWFGKLFDLDYTKLSELLRKLFNSDVITALMAGDHSIELQDYVDDVVPDYLVTEDKPSYVEAPPPAEVLPEVWKINTIEVAKSIKEVADKLKGTLQMLPSMEGRMVFETMAKFNKQRPSIGMYQASIKHEQVPDVLVILDVSGSMREDTIRAIVDDVVGLSWEAKAHLAIVSNNAYVWEPGSYNVDDVLAMAEYGGTQYEMLAPLLDRDWGTVVTIADYDSSRGAKQALACRKGRIGTVLDISLVGKPTFLSECVGQLADEVKPLLVAQGIMRSWY